MNQVELRRLAEERILDADALIKGRRWSYAYYVAGYVVECGLKSCVLARMVHTGWVFQEKAKIDQCLTHDFGELIRIAGLTSELNAAFAASANAGGEFVGNWGTAIQWKVTSRYENKSEQEAKALYDAITDNAHGVMLWIRNYW
jgi:hypothetical protein